MLDLYFLYTSIDNVINSLTASAPESKEEESAAAAIWNSIETLEIVSAKMKAADLIDSRKTFEDKRDILASMFLSEFFTKSEIEGMGIDISMNNGKLISPIRD